MAILPITVIIVAKNAGKTIFQCLSAISMSDPAEIIVVDGKSTDNTVEIAHQFTGKVYSDEGRGLNAARQLGVQMATQQFVAYVDSDVLLNGTTLRTMYEELLVSDHVSMTAQEEIGVCGATYWERAQYSHNQFRRSKPHFSTLASLIKREILLKYGFDNSPEGLNRYMDDLDLEMRLRRDGFTFGISSGTVTITYIDNLNDLFRYRFFLGRVSASYIKKYGPFHIRLWPPFVAAYWIAFCGIKAKVHLMPYFVVDCLAKTLGLSKGSYDLLRERAGKRQ